MTTLERVELSRYMGLCVGALLVSIITALLPWHLQLIVAIVAGMAATHEFAFGRTDLIGLMLPAGLSFAGYAIGLSAYMVYQSWPF